ncbi:MAG TPA: alpha/beta fold hydrolase [Vicinamibacterales bacterium]|nr:alpha/beta fold hydrolase [Vicinamibacterales bacterium]
MSRGFTALTALALSLAVGACAQTTSSQTPATGAAPGAEKPGATTPGAAAPPATEAAAPAPKALIATSADGTKIAYEVAGKGPVLLLVHGGGQTRRSWNQSGYVDRLAKQFTVVTLDLRGTGDSDKPIAKDAYALDRMLEDLIAVADAADAGQFHVWGFGHGGTIARYLPARSDRVASAVLIGMTMGPAVTGVFKTGIEAMRAKWQPVIDAHTGGTLDVKSMPTSDRTAWEAGIAANVLLLTSMIDYPPLEPTEIKAPTLWAVGSDDSAVENLKEYEAKLKGTQVTGRILSSVNYSDSFIKIDQIMETVEPFLKKSVPTT